MLRMRVVDTSVPTGKKSKARQKESSTPGESGLETS